MIGTVWLTEIICNSRLKQWICLQKELPIEGALPCPDLLSFFHQKQLILSSTVLQGQNIFLPARKEILQLWGPVVPDEISCIGRLFIGTVAPVGGVRVTDKLQNTFPGDLHQRAKIDPTECRPALPCSHP